MNDNFDQNSGDEQSADHVQGNHHNEQNGNEHQRQNLSPSDPMARNRNINGNGNGMSTPTSTRNAPSSSLASAAGKSNNKGNVQQNVLLKLKVNQKKKSPKVEEMREYLREMMKKPPPPPLPKMPAASSSSSSSTHQQQQKWNQQIGEEEMLKALKCLLENLRTKKAKQEANVDNEYNVVCCLRSIKTTGDEKILVEHEDGPFNDVDKPFDDNRLQALKAYAGIGDRSIPKETICPPAPLNMISLLQFCSEDPSLELEPTEAMEIATKLYDKGFITNPRTLATKFVKGFPSDDRIKQVIKQMDEICGAEGRIDAQVEKIYLSHWRPWNARNSQQRANPATTMNANEAVPIQPNLLGQLNLDEKRTLEGKEKAMYLLICRHFLATFHLPYKMFNHKFIFEIGTEKFKYECKVLDASGCNLVKIFPHLKPKGSLEKLPNVLQHKLQEFKYIVSDVEKCIVADDNDNSPVHGVTQSEFIGSLAENDCCVWQIPQLFKKLKEKKLITMVGQLITLSSEGMKKISDQIELDENVDVDDDDVIEDDMVENSDEVDSILAEANSFMEEQRAAESDSNYEVDFERSRSRQRSGGRNASPMPTSTNRFTRARTMPTSILHNRQPRQLPERLGKRVQFENPLARRSRSRDLEERATNRYNHDLPTPFPPRRPYNLRSGLRIENANAVGAEQNGNRLAGNVNAIDPAKYKTAICKFWLASQSCDFGDQCNFAHGQEELRNLNDSWEESAPSTRPTFRGLQPNRKRPYPQPDDADGRRNWQSRRNDGNVDNGRRLNANYEQHDEPIAKRPYRLNPAHQNFRPPQMPQQYQQQQPQGPMTRSRARAQQDFDGKNGNWNGNGRRQNGHAIQYGGQNGNDRPYGGRNVRAPTTNYQLNDQARNKPFVRTERMGQQQFRRIPHGQNVHPGPSNNGYVAPPPPTRQIGPKVYKGALPLPPQNDPPRQRMGSPQGWAKSKNKKRYTITINDMFPKHDHDYDTIKKWAKNTIFHDKR